MLKRSDITIINLSNYKYVGEASTVRTSAGVFQMSSSGFWELVRTGQLLISLVQGQ